MKKLLTLIAIIGIAVTSVSAADFNGDGKQDLVLYNPTTRVLVVWYMNGTVFLGGAYGPTIPAGWNYVTTADFNGDGHPDLLLFNPSTRQSAVWYLSGSLHLIRGVYGPVFNTGWYAGAASDIDYDGKMDIVAYRPATGQIYAVLLNDPGNIKGQYPASTVPAPWMLIGLAGFDAGRTNDLLLFNPSTKRTADWLMSWNSFRNIPWYLDHGYYGPTVPAGWSLVGAPDLDNNGSSDYLLIAGAQSAFWYLHLNIRIGAAYGPVIPAGYYLADDVAKPCQFRITPTNWRALVGGGFGTILVGCNSSHCGWSATSNAPWIHVLGTFPQYGPNSFNFSVDSNYDGPARTGTITVAGLTFVVSQAGQTANLTGTWSGPGTIVACNATYTVSVSLELQQSGTTLSGNLYLNNIPCFDGACTFRTYYSESSSFAGTVSGNTITGYANPYNSCGLYTDNITVTTTVNGDTMTGSISNGFDTMSISLSRQ